jgi:hypothetical protein
MIKNLKELGFKNGTLQDVTGSGLNTKEKIIYKIIPHYEKSYVLVVEQKIMNYY